MYRKWLIILASLLGAWAIAIEAGAAPFDLASRRASHWAWQPLHPSLPPNLADAGANPIDRFILAKLGEKGLSPAPEVDRRTLIRRASFALTGLPPTPREVDAFMQDAGPDAYEKVVDRLLASPRFGERWARHWMDLTRYADTLGNESDAPIPNAWRYRDYLIRAFNADLPYDQLVTEHIAGDLLNSPRRNPTDGTNESIVATGFFWLNEGKRAPVDVRQAQGDCFDNKIDVLCKTFLGLTVGCARCHDHKFDAISQADYYALYGYLESSRYTQALINGREWNNAAVALAEQKQHLREAAATTMLEQAPTIARYLLATLTPSSRPAGSVTQEIGLVPARLQQWTAALKGPLGVDHPMFPWARLAAAGESAEPAKFAKLWDGALVELKARDAQAAAARHRDGDVDLCDLATHGFSGWFSEEQAFGAAPSLPGDFLPGNSPVRPVLTFFRSGAWAHTGALSRKLQGTLRSPTFEIAHRYLHVRCAGRQARVNVNIEHYVMIQDPLYGTLRWVPDSDGAEWHTFDLGMWKGRRAYVEFADTTTPDLHSSAPKGVGADGYLALSRAVLSDQGAPTSIDPPPALALFAGTAIRSLPELANRVQSLAEESLTSFAKGELPAQPNADERAHLLAWLLEHGLLDGTGTALDGDVQSRVSEILGDIRQIELALPAPQRAPATIDGTPIDEHVFVRGNHKSLGPLTPRRMLQAIGGDKQPAPPPTTSGRLELARRFTDPANALISRVIVNRVWHHLMGRGIVASVDNFGVLGELPTHPELLDYLADGFIRDGWSIKRLARQIVLSRTFRMSSSENAEAERIDPGNRLFHRAMVRRLEGEAIRDAILQVSGRLDTKMYGPGVEVFITPFLDGGYIGAYGKPDASGPMDGDGRRSVYMMVRRNFLPPMMVAFDAPPPVNTAGRRSVSNVPAQALILMNDPFIVQQAGFWAKRVLAEIPASRERRIARMYEQAFSRPPADDEMETAVRFLDEHGQELGIAPNQRGEHPGLWTDLAHVLINVKEFTYLN